MNTDLGRPGGYICGFMVIICINLYDNEKSGVYQTMIGHSLGDKGKKHKCVMSNTVHQNVCKNNVCIKQTNV